MKTMMKSVMAGALVSLAMVAGSGAADAALCGSAGFDNLGALIAGDLSCTVDDKTFSDFFYQENGQFNSPVPASAVGVGPATTPNPGLAFNAPWNNAAGPDADAAWGFTVTSPIPIIDVELQIQNGFGTFMDTMAFPGTPIPPLVSSDLLLHRVVFPGVLSLDVTDNLTVSAGGGVSLIDKQFSQVPEPASLTLLGSALVGLGWLNRPRRKTS